MKITCPACGAGGSISLFMADADARRAVLAAARLPSDCGMATLKYIAMFGPRERFLTSTRAARLIMDCCDMILSGVDFDRDHITAPSYVWRNAMLEMIENTKIDRPIKNHHYLLRIVQTLLNKRSDVNQTERATDRRNSEGSRIKSNGMQSLSGIPPGPPLTKGGDRGDLPELPEDGRELWYATAREDLEKQGMHKNFIIKPLIEQRARELYAQFREAP